MKFFKRYAFWIASVFTIGFTILFFSTNPSAKKELNVVENLVYITSKPIELAFYYSQNIISSVHRYYSDLMEKQSTVSFLKKENADLKGQTQFLKALEEENTQFRKLLEFKERSAFQVKSCEVLQADPSFTYKNIRINRGSDDGIEYGMGVISADGIVGMVIRTTQKFSDVLLLTDPNSNVDVIVARNRRRGLLQGGQEKLMRFKYLEGGSDLFIGDQIITSGLTGAFPAGIPVGTVTGIKWSLDNSTQFIEVEPTTKLSQLAYAMVILIKNRDVDVIRKIGGEGWIKKLVESNLGKSNE